MTLTDRDKKIALVILPLAMVLGYWFVVLGPKRGEASDLGARLAVVEKKRDAAKAESAQLEGSKNTYAKDYETVVRLGKAIPATLDMPSLIVQLDAAADGTGIRFKKIRAGARNEAPPPPPPTQGGAGGDAAAGGKGASTDGGKATEQANGAAQTSGAANSAAGADAAATGSGKAAPGLDSQPLEFSFTGSFFDLADFFHSMKRFVRVANDRIKVSGRLLTIDGMTFQAAAFPVIKAEVRATVYLSPKSEGETAGATSQGPATTPAAGAPPAAPAGNTPVAQGGEDSR